ncbi:hypothetical protein F8M41_011812 [Gigaspora margarita]|uniref:F-box domain-containing protein n=1 Tax=Gigaspora margarita TaxID=4874 RepID=A0A8H3X0K8_GIGMA|nr:hypothetical protein F8M41_011812 [Gigaspora margarita]
METITATIIRHSFVTKQPASIVFHLAFPFFELNLVLSNWETNPNINRKNFTSKNLFPTITTDNCSTDRYLLNNVTSWIRNLLSNVYSQYEIVPSLIEEKIAISLNNNLCDTLEQCSQQCISIDNIQEIESENILRESSVINSIKEIELSVVSQKDSRFKELLYDEEIEYTKNNFPQETLYSSALPEQRIKSQNIVNEIDTCSESYPAVEQQDGFNGVVNTPIKSLESFPEKSREMESSPEKSCEMESSPEKSCEIESSPEKFCEIESSPEKSREIELSPEKSHEFESSPEKFREIESSNSISQEIQQIEESSETLQMTQSVSSIMSQESEIFDNGERCLLDNSLYVTVIPEEVESPIPIERAPASLGDIPLDIFIEICYHLPPNSLFALIGVCKQFRNWLRSSSSHITTDIWRTSRTKFITYLPRPPPAGIDEITYIKLAMLERGCQFCGAKTETPKVYWAFRVRCCSSCLRKRITTSPDNLPLWAKTPIDITTVVPYENVPVINSTTGAKIMAYLNSHLESARREFISTPPKYRANWIQKKKNMVTQILTNVQKRERLDELYLRKKSLEDMRTFKMLIEEFKQTKDDKGLKPYKEKYIVQLPSYIEAKEVYRIPFMTNPWPTFILRLKDEYTELMKKTVRLEQITNAILSLITSYDTLSCAINMPPGSGYQIYISDPVIDCLHWCPSFCNPPFVNNDPLIPWTDEFLIQTLIPKLRKEARRLVKKSKVNRPGPFTTVKGCINLAAKQFDDEDKELFVCKLCWKSSKRLHSYEAICRHLTSGCHSIGRVDNERMIEVDKDVVKKVLPNWFAGII